MTTRKPKTETPMERYTRLRDAALRDYRKDGKGQAWQRALQRQAEIYRLEGRALLYESSPPFVTEKVLPGNKRQGYMGSKGSPDFIGLGDGFCWAVDAKSVLRAPFKLDRIKDHQMEDSLTWGRLSSSGLRCAGGFLISLYEEERAWVVFARDLQPAWRRWKAAVEGPGRTPSGVASLSIDDLNRVGVPFDGADWLGVAAEAARHFFE